MFVVASLNRAKHVYRGNVRTSEGAIVHHLFDACAGRGDLRGEVRQTTGTITNHRAETAEPPICDQAALDYATKHVRINVAAAEQKYHALARQIAQFARQTGSDRRSSCAFDNGFFEFDDAQN